MFMDWDETISAHDTLSLIAPPEGEQRGPPFSSYGEAYVNDLQKHEREWRSKDEDEEVDCSDEVRNDLGPAWSRYWTFLRSLDAVELASQRRIEDGGLFVGFDAEAMDRRARDKVELRTGWPDFATKRLTADEIEWHVISVGWSARFIKAALGLEPGPNSICANEVELERDTGLGTGRLTKSIDALPSAANERQQGQCGIRTAVHKVREMHRTLRRSDDRQAGSDLTTIYFGDSPTDLGCLVEANVGVIIGGKGSMKRALSDAGLDPYVHDAGKGGCATEALRRYVSRTIARSARSTPCLVMASDWHEVDDLVECICKAIE